MRSTAPVITSDPQILGGTPVFAGTRVPLRTLIDYLEGGEDLDTFLDDFPTVSRDQAVAALEQAAWAAEIQRRAERIRRGEARGRPWSEVRDELERQSEVHEGP